MGLITMIWSPGKRTITLSVLAAVVAVLLQADSQGIIALFPMLKLSLNLILAVLLPMIPIYLRKGIEDGLNSGAKKAESK